MNLKDALLAVHWPNLAIKFLTQDKEKLWAMRWRQWNWLQTWLQICGREWILANCNQTTQTKLNALSYEAPTSCYTQDSCECKGHHATWSNLAATQAETPELFCRFSMIFHDFARSISQHQESKYKNSRNSMEPGSHWSLTSPFFCISWIVFLMRKTGPIDVTLDGLSVSLRTVPHSLCHGLDQPAPLAMPKKECGAMRQQGRGWTYSQQQNDPTQITLLHCKPCICEYHLLLAWGVSE